VVRWVDVESDPILRLKYLLSTPICDLCYNFPELCNGETLKDCGLVDEPPREAIDEDELDP